MNYELKINSELSVARKIKTKTAMQWFRVTESKNAIVTNMLESINIYAKKRIQMHENSLTVIQKQ